MMETNLAKANRNKQEEYPKQKLAAFGHNDPKFPDIRQHEMPYRIQIKQGKSKEALLKKTH